MISGAKNAVIRSVSVLTALAFVVALHFVRTARFWWNESAIRGLRYTDLEQAATGILQRRISLLDWMIGLGPLVSLVISVVVCG